MDDNRRLAVLRKRLGGINTLSDFFKNRYLPVFIELERRWPSKWGEAEVRWIRRYFEPWPDWVLSLIVEILRVHAPRIPKATINDTLRFFHFFVFVIRVDGPAPKEPMKLPALDARQLGAMVGHLAALFLNAKAMLKTKQISAEDYKIYADEFSVERLQTEIHPVLEDYFNNDPTKMFEFSEGFAVAKGNTFDKNGAVQETSLTKVYGQLVSHWPEIEELSGPTELCAFLNPALPKDHFLYESQLDRVKKICRRMEIEFKPFV